MKKLYRIKNGAFISGVCGGLADYIGVDRTVARLVFAAFVLMTGFFPGIILYVIGAVVMPVDDNNDIVD